MPADAGEPTLEGWESDEEPEPAKLPEWTAGGVKLKIRHQMMFSARNVDEDEEVMRLSWAGTPKQDSTRIRSGHSRRNQFAGSPGRKYAASAVMDPLTSSVGSRGLRR